MKGSHKAFPVDQEDDSALESLLSWVVAEDAVAVPIESGPSKMPLVSLSEFNGLPAVVKRILGDRCGDMPQEWLLQLKVTAAMDQFGLSESEAGIVRLRKVTSGDDDSWSGTMGRCPVTLDRVFPALYELLHRTDSGSRALYQHVLFAVFSSLVRMLDTFALTRVVHGDFKPQNIGSSPTDDPRYEGAQVAFDWGISRSTGELFATGECAGVFAGTLAYMSEESFCNVPAHPSRDVFACGKILEGLADGREVEFAFGGSNHGGVGGMYQQLYQLSEDYDRAHDQERDRLLKQYGKTEDCDDVLSVGGKPLSLMVREGLSKEMRLRGALRNSVDFIACYRLVIAQMCHQFPEYRPSLYLLKFAAGCMESLLPPLPVGVSVSGFFKSVALSSKEGQECSVTLSI